MPRNYWCDKKSMIINPEKDIAQATKSVIVCVNYKTCEQKNWTIKTAARGELNYNFEL